MPSAPPASFALPSWPRALRRLGAFALLTHLALLSLAACHGGTPGPTTDAAASGPAVRVQDDLDRTVAIPAPAQRVLSLSPAATEWIFALGQGARLVGRTDACDFPPEARAVPSIGGLFPPDLERLYATAPDLVIMMDAHGDLRLRLEARGLPVFVHQPQSVDQALRAAPRLGRLLGVEARGQELEAALRRQLPPRAQPREAALYVVWGQPLSVAGGHTFLSDVLAQVGLRNAAGALTGPWPTLSLEQLVALDPALLVLGAPVDLAAPGWRALSAVRHQRVLRPTDPDLLVRPGPRLVEGLRALYHGLHALTAAAPAAPSDDNAAQPAGSAAQPADSAAQPAGSAAQPAGSAAQPAGSAAQPDLRATP